MKVEAKKEPVMFSISNIYVVWNCLDTKLTETSESHQLPASRASGTWKWPLFILISFLLVYTENKV